MGKDKRESDQPDPRDLTPLLAPLSALQNLLSSFGDQGVIIGGIAVSLLGTPRFTADLDAVFLLSINDIPIILSEASRREIEPRIPDAEAFARKNRVLLLRHIPSGIDIDLALGILPFEIEMVKRSAVIDVGPLKLRLPTPEDLIILKAIAHRPKDLEDIRAIASSHSQLDKQRIQYWVEEFAEALDMPELWGIISKFL